MDSLHERSLASSLRLLDVIHSVWYFATQTASEGSANLVEAIDDFTDCMREAPTDYARVRDSIHEVASVELGAAHDEIFEVARAIAVVAGIFFAPTFEDDKDGGRARRDAWGLWPAYPLSEHLEMVRKKFPQFQQAMMNSPALKEIDENWFKVMRRRCTAESKQAEATPPRDTGAATSPTAIEKHVADGSKTPPVELSIEFKAMAMLITHPDRSIQQIAKAIGCHRTTLYKCRAFMAAHDVKIKSQQKPRRIVRGTKDSKTRELEAWSESDDVD